MKAFIHNDHDGRCAGSILYNKLGAGAIEPTDFIEMDYKKRIPVELISKDERVYFLDYSFSKENIDQLKHIYDNITEYITWIDHHATSVETIKNNKWIEKSKINIFVQEGISGAGLTYIYLNRLNVTPLTFAESDKIPYYLKLIDDFDCWKLKMIPESTYLKLAIDSFKVKNATAPIWRNMYMNEESILQPNNIDFGLLKEGRIINRYVEAFNKEYLDNNGYESEIDGHKCYVVNIDSNSWVFGDLINKYDVVLIWTFDGEVYDYSIYSANKSIDCSKIASRYGGGGHPGASGFTQPELILKKK